MKIHQVLRIYRAARGWTQADTADRAGISQAHLCHCEAGKRQPGVQTLEGLAKAFSVPVHDFMLWLDYKDAGAETLCRAIRRLSGASERVEPDPNQSKLFEDE